MNMKKNFSCCNTLKSKKIILLAILMMIFFLGSCKSIDVKNKPDLLTYMLKPVALLPTNSPRNLDHVWADLMSKMEQKLSKIPNLGRIAGIEELNNKLDANPKLRSAYKKYLSTLTLTGISEKEIALRLKDEFRSPHFLLLDFVSFPCTEECPSDEQWVIRLKLIEVSTGEIISRVRLSHQLDKDEQNAELYKDLAEDMISEVITEFKEGYIVPWHRWRFEHMKKVSEISLRSEIGI